MEVKKGNDDGRMKRNETRLSKKRKEVKRYGKGLTIGSNENDDSIKRFGKG